MCTLLQISKDKEQPNQQLAEKTEVTTPQGRDVPTASTDGSSTSTSTGAPPNSSSLSTTASDPMQASNNLTIVNSSTPLLQTDDLNSADTGTKESSAPLQMGGDSSTADLSCPDVNERSENLLQSEAKTQEDTPIQINVHSWDAGVSNSSVIEPKNEETSQEVNPLQTSSHSLAADVSSSGVSGSSSEGKSQEAKEDGDNDQIVPS